MLLYDSIDVGSAASSVVALAFAAFVVAALTHLSFTLVLVFIFSSLFL